MLQEVQPVWAILMKGWTMSRQNKPFSLSRRIIFSAIIAVFVIVGAFLLFRQLSARTHATPIPIDISGPLDSPGTQMTPIPNDFNVQLSEGKPQSQAVQATTVAAGEPLSPGEAQQILARLPTLPAQPGDETPFKLAQGPIPPPQPGETIQQSFPPQEQAAGPTPIPAGPLEVLRYSPEGEVSVAPFISVTFNQPMVPLTTLGQLSAQDVPVKIDPPLEGTWRWLGTRTLTFEYDSTLIDRLPKATEYRVSIPAGTKSTTGGTLAKAVTWSFTTPTPTVVTVYPSDIPQTTNPLFFIAFDQRIDPAAMLKAIHVQAGSRNVSLKLAGADDVQADQQVSMLAKNALDGRWLAFKAQEPLPTDTQVSVTIGPNTPSAEGPLTSGITESYSFHTYAPLRIEEHGCYWSDQKCVPLSPMYIQFNNPIDSDTFNDSLIRVKPEIPGLTINAAGTTIELHGMTKGQTTYTVSVSGDVQDQFGQRLGQDDNLSFKVGPADPNLFGPGQPFVTLDPSLKTPVFPVYSINYSKLDVKVYAVQPKDWPAFQQYMATYSRDLTTRSTPPGRLAINKTMQIEAASDALTQVDIDLSPAMDGKFGQFVVVVQPPSGLFKNPNDYRPIVQTWVQVTQIGLDAFVDQTDMVAWTTNLQDGSALPDVTITPGLPDRKPIATAQDGIARFPIPSGASYLVAKLGADQALLPRSTSFWYADTWSRQTLSDEMRWYVLDDRQMYRPGEEIHVKGFLRKITSGPKGDVQPLGSEVGPIRYQLIESQGNNLLDGQVQVDALGGFDFTLKLPESMNLGSTQIILTASNPSGMTSAEYYHSIQVAEFRRPEFEVVARNESPGPYFAGDSATVAVKASYYAGGPLPGADVTWTVRSTPGQYSPPNWPDFSFGSWTPWWSYEMPYNDFGGPFGTQTEQGFTGVTDTSGEHYLKLDFSSGTLQPISMTAQATVMDVNRQAWTGSTSLLVHPADLYVGLKTDRYFVQRGQPLKVDFIVTDLDGKPVSDRPVLMTAARLEWKFQHGSWQEVEADTQTCNQGSTDKPGACSFTTEVGGTYRITATVTDEMGRKNQSKFTRWVSGSPRPPSRAIEQEQLTLIPDKETYQPGETAEVLVQAPFSPAEGLLTLTRSGIVSTQRFTINDGSIILRIPIEEGYIPNLNIQVDLTGTAPRTSDTGDPVPNAPARPAYASGTLDLKVPPQERTLSVQLSPNPEKTEPGGSAVIHVAVKDAQGKPVEGAQVTVFAVDEAILALTNYSLADPLAIFYTGRPSMLSANYARASIILADPLALASDSGSTGGISQEAVMDKALGAMPGAEAPMAAAQPTMMAERGGGAYASAQQQPIRVRSDFNPLAVFAPAAMTGADGNVQVQVKLPDNLTRYRIMAVAANPTNQFGSADANLTARLPLMVRPAAPRFLNFGDQFELPVVIQNQTDETMTVDVAVRASNLELTGPAGLRVSVPANDRVEVRFPAAAQSAGTARYQIAAVSGNFADAASGELPVYTPATSEAFAVYGVVDSGAVSQPVLSPSDVFPQFGGLEISTSSTALQALTDAVLYLVSYPYECSEQLSSRILAVSALRDVLTAFDAEGLPSAQEMESAVQRDITTLQGMQNDDGGFPYWQKGRESIPFNTIHTAHALYQAQSKGFTVPAEMQQAALGYLRDIESHYPPYYSQRTRQTLSAYALYVRHLMGDRDPQKALQLIDQAGLDNLSLDAIGWLWQSILDAPEAQTQLSAIRQEIGNRVVETAGAANFTTSYDEQDYLLLGSSRRTDAILLSALIEDNPQSDLIPKVVNGLLAHRTKGRWGNTQENVFVLLALDRYFNTYKSQTPDFTARIWLGQDYAGENAFQGYSSERYVTNVPMNYLLDQLPTGQTSDLVLSKEGDGRLYYRLGLRYAPTNLQLDPLDMGFAVSRVYEAVDDPKDVSQDANGVWHIRAGAKVRVRVSMAADNRRYHVALSDPLPAGLEILNPALAVSESNPPDVSQGKTGWWWWSWFEHQNLRDERAEAFTSLLWDGVYEYTYYARATTPGRFVVPPTKAEEMYSPEVFGRSASDVVIVE